MKIRLFGLYVLCLISTSAFAQMNPWSIGLQGGYSALGSVGAVPVQNSFPVALSMGYQISDFWNAKLGYQWIKSEHIGSQSAIFQTFRASAEYQFWNMNLHFFKWETGLGYQLTRLSSIDRIRQMELFAGPTWSWNVSGPWHLESSLKYARSFDGWMSTSMQRLDVGIGMSFHFGSQSIFYSKSSKASLKDADQDGVPDSSDECISTPYGMKVAKNGCALDGDGDLVVDYNDYCPNTKRGSEVDEMGCPLNSPGRGVIDGISFEFNSPRLTASSKSELEKVALTLRNYPNIFFVIEGYSFGETSASERMNVSKARAVTVMNILASYGIPSSKMKAIGLSDQYPLTDSTNRADQILNERIEIKWKHQL